MRISALASGKPHPARAVHAEEHRRPPNAVQPPTWQGPFGSADHSPGRHACACGGRCPRCTQSQGARASDVHEREAEELAAATVQAPLGRRRGGESGRAQEDWPRAAAPLPTTAASALNARPRWQEQALPLASSGAPLAAADREFFEAAWGRDLGAVRVHTDAVADRSARSLGALAYTVGSQVVFRSGAYAPASHTGRRLLAHELVHTLQQREGAARSAGQGWRGPVQKADAPGENAVQDEWVVRMRALRDITREGKMTKAQEEAFVAGLNEVVKENAYSEKAGVILPVKTLPNLIEYEPGHVYFDPSMASNAAGVTQAICRSPLDSAKGMIPTTRHVPGQGNTRRTCAAGQYLGNIIMLGPECVLDTRSFTQSVFEHESVHYFLSWYRQNIEHAPSPETVPLDVSTQQRYDEEALAYAHDLTRIFQFSREEITTTLRSRLRYYSAASEIGRTESDEWVAASLASARAASPNADLSLVRTLALEAKDWASLPDSLENPANLTLVQASADRMLALLAP